MNSHDIDMKLGPVTKLDMGNLTTSKKIGFGAISVNCDVIATFSVSG